jgi:isoleucyl-tRNA synthetase
LFITSDAKVHQLKDKPLNAINIDNSLAILVRKSEYEKCIRCWHHRPEIGQNKLHKELCGRCIENIAGDGETRIFA